MTLPESLKALGLTQRRFAKLTGAHPCTVNGWCRGRAKTPPWVGLLVEAWMEIKPVAVMTRMPEHAPGPDAGWTNGWTWKASDKVGRPAEWSAGPVMLRGNGTPPDGGIEAYIWREGVET